MEKSACSCWFVIIFLFFILKKIFDISKYYIFNHFTFFFWSKDVSNTF